MFGGGYTFGTPAQYGGEPTRSGSYCACGNEGKDLFYNTVHANYDITQCWLTKFSVGQNMSWTIIQGGEPNFKCAVYSELLGNNVKQVQIKTVNQVINDDSPPNDGYVLKRCCGSNHVRMPYNGYAAPSFRLFPCGNSICIAINVSNPARSKQLCEDVQVLCEAHTRQMDTLRRAFYSHLDLGQQENCQQLWPNLLLGHQVPPTTVSTQSARPAPQEHTASDDDWEETINAMPDDEPEQCSICLLPLRGALTKIDCNHSFHFNCLVTWETTQTSESQGNSSCPLCRRAIQLHYNYTQN